MTCTFYPIVQNAPQTGSGVEFSGSAETTLPEYFQPIKFSDESLVKALQAPHLVHIPPSHNLLSLDTSLSSRLTSALWGIKYTLILQSYLQGTARWAERWPPFFWSMRRRFIKGLAAGAWSGVLTETQAIQSMQQHLWDILMPFLRHPPPELVDLVFLWGGSKDSKAPRLPHMFPVFAEERQQTRSDQTDAFVQEHTGLNFHLSHSWTGPNFGVFTTSQTEVIWKWKIPPRRATIIRKEVHNGFTGATTCLCVWVGALF